LPRSHGPLEAETEFKEFDSMQTMMTVILLVQVLAAVAMIGLVLVQQGKGADMGASFGGGASGSLFGATGSANFLSRSTAVAATVFFTATLALAYLGSRPQTASEQPSLLEQAASAAAQSAAPAVPASPAAPASGAALIPAR
jgi:preprotein translocase subunit SecG